MRNGATNLIPFEAGVLPDTLREAVPATTLQRIGEVSCLFWQNEAIARLAGGLVGSPQATTEWHGKSEETPPQTEEPKKDEDLWRCKTHNPTTQVRKGVFICTSCGQP